MTALPRLATALILLALLAACENTVRGIGADVRESRDAMDDDGYDDDDMEY